MYHLLECAPHACFQPDGALLACAPLVTHKHPSRLYCYSRSALAVLPVGLGAALEQQLGAVGMTERDRVEERGAAVAVRDVHLSPAQGDEGVDTVGVAAAGGAVQRWGCSSGRVRPKWG